jgi:preprotein translocase subunit SecD
VSAVRRTVGLLVSLSILGGLGAVGCSSSPAAGPAATTTSARGPELVRYPFASGDATAEQGTVDVLNRRFEIAGLAAHAELGDQEVIIRSTGEAPPSTTVLRALAHPGSLHFRPVVSDTPCALDPSIDTTTPPTVLETPAVVTDIPQLDEHLATVTNLPQGDAHGSTVATWCVGAAVLDNRVIESVTAGTNSNGGWELRPVMKAGADGIDAFNAVASTCLPPSRTCPTGQLAITLDGVVLSAPTIRAPSFERDQITISSNDDEARARQIAALLDTGPLPAPLVLGVD